MRATHLTIVIMLLTTTVVYASDPKVAARKQGRPAAARPQIVERSAPDGDDAYKANCARCHAAPRKTSERQTATIMLHMRARANLTAAQTDAILQYLIR